MAQKTLVEIGDRLVRFGNPESVWVVQRFLEFPHMPKHVQMVREGPSNRTLTMAVTTVQDGRQFGRIEVA